MIGESAGAIICAPSIQYIEQMDEKLEDYSQEDERLSVSATIVSKRENITHHGHANAGDLSGTHGYHSTSSTSYYVTFQGTRYLSFERVWILEVIVCERK